jgi:hypothetical protein
MGRHGLVERVDDLQPVPPVDSTANQFQRDVGGNKGDTGSLALGASVPALARKGAKEAWEAEHHVHNGERWFGAAAAPSGETHIADRIGAGAAGSEAGPLVLDAGNDDWGTWTQILGSSDTPTDGGAATYYDPHRIRIAGTEHDNQRYMIQVAQQEDAPDDDPGSSDTYTEFEVHVADPAPATQPEELPFDVLAYRAAAGTKMWARVRAPNQNTSTISFYLGLHEYTDPDV